MTGGAPFGGNRVQSASIGSTSRQPCFKIDTQGKTRGRSRKSACFDCPSAVFIAPRGHSLRGGPLTGPRAFFGARFLIIASGKRARSEQQRPNGPADRPPPAIYAESGPPDPAAQDGGNCICVASATFFAADYRRCCSAGQRRTALATSGRPNSVVWCAWGPSWTRLGAYRGYFCLTDELRSARSAVARGKAVGWPLPRPGSSHTLSLPRLRHQGPRHALSLPIWPRPTVGAAQIRTLKDYSRLGDSC